MATQNGAQGLRKATNFGKIAPGLFADFVILKKDPLKDIKNSRSIEMVFKEGKIYTHQDLLGSLKK